MDLVIYAIELERLVDFYQQALDFSIDERDETYARLLRAGEELVLLQAPADIVSQHTVSSPPKPRAATPLKPVWLSNQPMAELREKVVDAGGLFNEVGTEWHFRENRVCDGADPEGNIFQVRTLDLLVQRLHLREARPDDLEMLEYWETQAHVIAAGIDGDDWQWAKELQRRPAWREFLIAEHAGRAIGVVQVIDPALEESHYWGDTPANLRAIDIWLGEASDLGRGYGSEMMRQLCERCFNTEEVEAILIDPLASNTRAHNFYRRAGFEFVESRMFDDDHCHVFKLTRDRWASLPGLAESAPKQL